MYRMGITSIQRNASVCERKEIPTVVTCMVINTKNWRRKSSELASREEGKERTLMAKGMSWIHCRKTGDG